MVEVLVKNGELGLYKTIKTVTSELPRPWYSCSTPIIVSEERHAVGGVPKDCAVN